MHILQHTIKHNTGIKNIIQLFSEACTLSELQHSQLDRNYYDSFDWRLYHKNYQCGVENIDGSRNFFIRDKDSEEPVWEFPIHQTPHFAQDVDFPSCKKELAKILDIRALIPVTSIHIKRKQFNIINKSQKILASISIENYTFKEPHITHKIPSRLLVIPVKGFHKTFEKINHLITDQIQLTPVGTSLLDEILAHLDTSPLSLKSVARQELSASLNTWQAARILLQHLLNIMLHNESGVKQAIDTEFLHDFRVAVRRTRSAISQIKHIINERELAQFKQGFYWLGSITTPTRDLDVYLLKFDSYVNELPRECQIDILPLQTFLKRHWQQEHEQMCEALNSEKYRTLMTSWQEVLQRDNIDDPNAINATKLAKQVADKRIWKLYKQVVKEGKAINNHSADETLHELRKSCKKLRYMMEFFQDYYQIDDIKHLINALKQLQDNLGDFQDFCVQIDHLIKFAEQMQEEKIADTKTIMAMGVLVEKLIIRKQNVRSHFEEKFDHFVSTNTTSQFKQVFHSKIKQQETDA